MNILLRSVMVADKADKADLAYQNFLALHATGLTFDGAEDVAVWEYITDFGMTHNHAPDIATLRAHFTAIREDGVVSRLEALTMYAPLYRGDFEVRLTKRMDERRVRTMADLLRQAATITQTGIEVVDGKTKRILHGPVDAMNYLVDKAHEVVAPITNARLSGEVTNDVDDFMAEYERRKADPLSGIGQFTGLAQMDEALSGAKRAELWTHAAFTGGLKSTEMINWTYNQSVYFGHSSVIFSLEMPYDQVRRIFMAIHSLHPRFRQIRIDLGLQPDPLLDTGLSYQKMRDGQLSDAEELFLREYVNPDFKGVQVVPPMPFDPSGGYGKIHIEVAPPEKTDFTMMDVKSRAEVLYQKSPFQMIFLDHMGLMSPRKWVQSTTERLNEVVRDAKRLAMSFNRGQGIAVVGLFQISREGFKAAEKNGGNYNLTHLSYANECCKYSELLQFSRGMLPICEAVEGDRVWSASGWKDVLAVFPKGKRLTWQVVTDRGSTLDCTENHRVRVLRDERVGWEYVGNLQAGDWTLGSKSEYPFADTNAKLDTAWAGVSEMNTDLAYALGAWHGDGVLRRNSISFTGSRTETKLEERIIATMERLHGSKNMAVYHHPSRKGSFDLSLYATDFAEWFEGLAGKRGLEVPKKLMQSKKECLLAFLQGVFDTDGWVNNQGVIGVKMAGKSEPLLRALQGILTALGYDSTLEANRTSLKATGLTYSGWTLRLRGRHSSAQFAKEIQFTEPAKAQAVLRSLLKTVKDKRMYPVAGTFLRVYREVFPAAHSKKGTDLGRQDLWKAVGVAKKKGLVSHGDLVLLLDLAGQKGLTGPDLDLLSKVVSLHVMRVKSCGPTGREEPVYDLEVSGDHEYQTGPVLSHNCERSSDVVTTSYVDDNLRKENKVRFQCLKSRDNRPFDPFFARVEWPYRRILNSNDIEMIDSQKDAVGAAIDAGV